MDYNAVNEQLQGRCKDSRRYGNNTHLIRHQLVPNADGKVDVLAMRYHKTDVVKWYPNGDIVLDSGGWRTKTTKERIGWCLPHDYRMLTTNGVWYIKHGDWATVVFADGITIHADGTVTGAGVDNPKADKLFKAKVKAYAQLCSEAIPLPHPHNGDCWYCHLATDSGTTLGDAMGTTDHIKSHLEKSYVVPSLVCNALEEAKAGHLIMINTFEGGGMRDVAQTYVKRSVYRYILKRFGYAV